MQSKHEVWIRIVNDIRNCRLCPLHSYRRNPVPGEGSLDTDVVFLGEAPGRKEDETGRPFVGAAGQLLNKLISDIGLDRSKVFITNVVKCRPPNNRDPKDEEIRACSVHTNAILSLIKP
ncbi:MAG TPA: uracil-DNA glycosylase, partial [Acidilobales archaeon]|nr:uracil-DNA glycosylase [Acidilobales archaeon]